MIANTTLNPLSRLFRRRACMCVCVCACVCVSLCICDLLTVARHLGMAISVMSATPLCKCMCDCVIVSVLLYAAACHQRHGAVCVRVCAVVFLLVQLSFFF